MWRYHSHQAFKVFSLVVFDSAGEFPPRSVQHVSPVKLLAGVYAHPGFIHRHLRTSPTPGYSRSTPQRAPYVANSALRRSLANEVYGVIRYDKRKLTSGSLDPKGAFVSYPLG